MKPLVFLLAAVALAACTDSKPPAQQQKRIESVDDIPMPVNVPPPVEALAYDDGYKAGTTAGEAAAKAQLTPKPKTRPKPPKDEDLAVYALSAAGTDSKRGQKWQRGFANGFRDAFVGIVEGKK